MSSSDEEVEAYGAYLQVRGLAVVKAKKSKAVRGLAKMAKKKAPVASVPECQPGPSTSSPPRAFPAPKAATVKQVVAPAVKKDLQLIGEHVSGRIKSFHVFRGWGFIKPAEGDKMALEDGEVVDDVFFSNKDLNENSATGARLQAGNLAKCVTLKVDQTVVFDLFQDAISGKLQAMNIKGTNGGLLEPDEAWVIKTDRDNLVKQVAKLSMKVGKLTVKKREEERGLCILCKEEPANIMFQPCNHVAACEKCYLANVNQFQAHCMVCRAPVGIQPTMVATAGFGGGGFIHPAPGNGKSRVGPTVKVFIP
ncbi:hypothetical protein RvY_18264 [Ramazzottius varieornatus]|uniref:RING-type domain-containing protein n=1 Tax=Ramazzottius varieornatus TaxID=947166 RepID=A0A1D1WAY2_RAMVA|nr:hypothetical protein RvY_18264 [Ramazzottius varieornatus]